MNGKARIGRRGRWLSIVAAANLVAVGLVAAPAQASGVSLCSGTAEGFIIAGDLAVPAGASCTLVNSTVRGNVVVRDEANLSLDGSTVRGNLTVRTGGFVDALGSTIRGTTRLREAFGGVLEGSELRGRVVARDTGFVISDGSSHGGDVISTTGQTVVLSSQIDANLRTTGDTLTDLQDSVITGRLSVREAVLGSVVCRSEVDEDAVLSENNDLIQIGPGAFGGCDFNVFGGDLVLLDNLADIQINGNVIRGDLACTGNDPEPTGADNRIRGEATGQCAGLGAAALAAAPFSAAGTVDSRVAGLLDRAEARAAAAQLSAAAAGPANL
jgi:hypothetical protein